MQCPKGHTLPFRTKNGATCTPKWCGDAPLKFNKKLGSEADPNLDTVAHNAKVREDKLERTLEKASAKQEAAIEALDQDFTDKELRESVGKAVKAERAAVAHALAIRQAKTALSHKPDNLQGEAAEKWAADRLTHLLPEAIVELESQLKTGAKEDRRWATDRILNATGYGKADKAAASTSPIVINISGGLPWEQAKPVEAQIVPKAALPDAEK